MRSSTHRKVKRTGPSSLIPTLYQQPPYRRAHCTLLVHPPSILRRQHCPNAGQSCFRHTPRLALQGYHNVTRTTRNSEIWITPVLCHAPAGVFVHVLEPCLQVIPMRDSCDKVPHHRVTELFGPVLLRRLNPRKERRCVEVSNLKVKRVSDIVDASCLFADLLRNGEQFWLRCA